MSRMHKLAALIVLAGAACSVGYAQDARVQYGDILDASPLAGSGGRNTASTGALLRDRGYGLGQGSQLLVSGRVTGLGAFHGGLPYTPKGQFHLTLPSARLSDFNRRSVGLEAVLRGQTYKPNPYFSRASTVLGAGGILSGRGAVGTNIPKPNPYFSRASTVLGAGGILSGRGAVGTNIPKTTAIVPSLTRKLRVDASIKYRALLPPQPGRALSVTPIGLVPSTSLMTPSGTTGLSKAPSEPAEAMAPAGSALPAGFMTRAGAIALFGALQADSRSRLAWELYQMGDPIAPIDRRVDRYVDGAVDSEYKLGGEQTLPEELFATDANSPLAGRGLVRGPAAARWAAPRRNEDVYLDILLRLREQQPTRPPIKQPSDTVETPVKTPVKTPIKRIVELDEKGGIVVHGLAGLGKDQLNAYMAIAQDRLKRGRYYEAVDRFQLVRIFDRTNPLPLMGMGLAYFGAGEAYSAGLQFRAAIEMLPPLIESRIDVAAMMDIKDARAQLVNLEERLRGDPYTRRDPHVYFAACFMSRNVGNRSEAIRYAEIIQKLAPENKIIRAYAQLVLTGKLQKDMKPTKPTTQKAKD